MSTYIIYLETSRNDPDFVFKTDHIPRIRNVSNKFWGSRHFHLTKYTSFDEEFNFQKKNQQFQRPEANH